MMVWLWGSALLMAVTAIIHSVAGETRLIGPLVAPGNRAIPSGQGRKVLRSAWHLTSAFMLGNALVVIWPASPAGLIRVIGAFWLLVGLFAMISSRGKHVGWPTLSLAGLTALIGVSV